MSGDKSLQGCVKDLPKQPSRTNRFHAKHARFLPDHEMQQDFWKTFNECKGRGHRFRCDITKESSDRLQRDVATGTTNVGVAE
jgi:hypothetical protein